MGLDIRWPIGLMFTFIGVLLIGYGICQQRRLGPARHEHQPIWGVVLLVFGVLMLLGAMRGSKTTPPAA